MTAMKERVHVVLAAGGAGSRMGAGQNKIFLEAGGKSILLRSMQLFEGIIDRMVIVCRPEWGIGEIAKLAEGNPVSIRSSTV